jgi:hypothetical protein
MIDMRKTLAGVGLVAVLAFVLGTRADEEKVPLDKLPKVVVDAVKAKFPGAELVSASKEKEGDGFVFEVAIKNKGQDVDVTLKPDGTIIEIEETIAARDLPKAVAEALDKKYPRADVKKYEKITKGDKLDQIFYEMLLVTAEKKTVEAVFDPTGKLVKEEKKDEKKEEPKKDK